MAAEIARALSIPLDLIIVRKIQLPWTTEAGFGALDPAGRPSLTKTCCAACPCPPRMIEAQVKKTAAVMRQREERLRGGKPYARLNGQAALVVDDGLASGYTMRAALQFLKAQGAGRLIVAVPTGLRAHRLGPCSPWWMSSTASMSGAAFPLPWPTPMKTGMISPREKFWLSWHPHKRAVAEPVLILGPFCTASPPVRFP